ncbi:hypothetical protein VOLCADRAFT_98737 [Volvox carteri f. nagariensis]|uniref:Major facilitator superfamily (MFS) profile domain-containing protein n=1 Tax=Volvox carteri f. nagariensis TaxID=3068 RepID=D8UG58_VOLCA|nr:uncharacterized protein VOLCADRAFT_98737 [Volvox carteri f. nagariensis]EFJ41294.1 hypothetical protein VOLCADRAFT_98737 [Volvox carteri f. nagariensis]|eukprot:XP_002957628.1 hypothetical protein VOLCADRAFT_98737 [Volvox carteri f. nagariensis]
MFKQEPVKQPCWYTPHRLVAYFCLVLLMTWIDQGLVASNQGEAPLLTLTFTFVDDVAPRASATLWFGVLGLAPVLGIGAGYVLAEPLTSAAGGSGSSTGLRWAFFIEALVSMPLTAFALFAPAVHLNMATSTPPPKPATARSVAASPSSATPTAANPTTTTTPGTPASVGTLATGLVPPPLSLPFAGGGDGGVREGAGASASSGSGAPITAQLQGSRRYPGGIRGCTACGGNLLSESATAAGDTSTSTSGRPLHPPPPPRPAGKCEHVDLDPAAVVGAVSYTKLEGGQTHTPWIFGMVSFWAPKAAQEIFRLRGSGPEFLIGVIAVVSGVLGTLAGGVLLDRWGSSLENGFRLQTVAVAGALVFMQLAFLAARSFTVFCVLLSAGLISLFAVQAPSYALSMWTVPLRYRPISQAAIILLQHALGDVPSPPATVALHDAFKLGGSSGNGGRSSGREWRLSLALSSAYLGFAVVLFGAGTLLARRGRALDFRLQQQQGQEGEGEHGQDEREEVDESQMLCGVCGRRAG